jgi:hypothetical protein
VESKRGKWVTGLPPLSSLRFEGLIAGWEVLKFSTGTQFHELTFYILFKTLTPIFAMAS